MDSDVNHNVGSLIYLLHACRNHDAHDLLAVGTDHSVEVLRVTDSVCESIALFHLGSRITALAWSSKSVSPSSSDEWLIELACAGSDFGLHLLTKSSTQDEDSFSFGGGLSGHHGKVTDMTFCGGRGHDSTRYVATVSDDKMLMVWDLHPTIDIHSNLGSPRQSLDASLSLSPRASRPQPTAYVIAFPHPLTSVNSHPATSKEFLVSDCRGSIFLTDWRSDPDDPEADVLRNSSLVELLEPHALSDAALGLARQWSGSVAWREDSPEIVGAVYGSMFSIWDTSKLQGGKPSASGNSFPESGHRFRWCQTYPEYFAISTQSPTKGAVIHVHNTNYIFSQPTVFNVASRPHIVRDFDFLSSLGIPRIAAAVGRSVRIFQIGIDS